MAWDHQWRCNTLDFAGVCRADRDVPRNAAALDWRAQGLCGKRRAHVGEALPGHGRGPLPCTCCRRSHNRRWYSPPLRCRCTATLSVVAVSAPCWLLTNANCCACAFVVLRLRRLPHGGFFTAVATAHEAFKEWSALSGAERGRILGKAASFLHEAHPELARLEVCGHTHTSV